MDRRNFLKSAAASLVSVVAGCQYDVKDHLRGHEVVPINEEQSPYTLDDIVIADMVKGKVTPRRFLVQEGPTQGDTRTILLYPHENVTRWVDRDSRKVTLETDVSYIPRLQKNAENKTAFKVNLMEKAVVEEPEIAGVSYDVITTTQKNARYNLRPIRVKVDKSGKTEDFYFPIVSAPEQVTEDSKLNFYMIPAKGTEIGIGPDGTLMLRRNGGIFRPMKYDKSNTDLTDVLKVGQTEYK